MAFTANGLVTLTSDFGTQDGYVGAMKGVIYREHPSARVVDITHDIAPQDVRAGAFALWLATGSFPAGTMHVAVVDPGVGSSRRAVAVEWGGQLLIGPDNGLLSSAAPLDRPEEATVWDLDSLPTEWRIQPTFHGRDVFARVAGRLAAGASLGDFSSGPVRSPAVVLHRPPRIITADDAVDGEVIHIDRFGNLVSNVSGRILARIFRGPQSAAVEKKAKHPDPAHALNTPNLPNLPNLIGRWRVELAGHSIPLLHTYADVNPGELVAYIGSAGNVEVAVREQSAYQQLGAERGTALRVVPTGERLG